MATDSAFLTKLLATFQVEASEHIQAMTTELVELERMPTGEQRTESLERIFREAHSLKGAARAVNHLEMETVCHALESVFSELKNNCVAATLPLFDLLHQTLKVLRGLLDTSSQAGAGAQKNAVATLVRQLEDILIGVTPAMHEFNSLTFVGSDEVADSPGRGTSVPASSLAPNTIRVHTRKLDSVMRQAEELLVQRLAAANRARELRELGITMASWKKDLARIQSAARAVGRAFRPSEMAGSTPREQQSLAKLLEYLDAESSQMKHFENRLTKLEGTAAHDHRILSGLVDGLLHDVKEMHMQPFSSLLETLPRLARELSRDHGKQVELVILGDDIEIDRRILEQIKDPLNHLLRNCVDHGVEKPDVRKQRGKPAHATLTIAISHKDSNKVEILVADDGDGIELAKVRTAAARLGILSAEEIDKLNERDVLALVFQSGVSTSPMVTDLSGRGLGLAIVREKVERLGGTVTLETQPKTGTTFRITLPLTLATFRGVIVLAGDRLFIIPAVSVEQVALVDRKNIMTVGNGESITLEGQALALVWLSDVLEIPRMKSESRDRLQVAILRVGANRIAFRVDAVLAEQEVLVKGLGPQLRRVRHVAGASVLGTGQVIPVLNVPDLMLSAKKPGMTPLASATGDGPKTEKQSILVAEDSITSRALIKNILEAAGYDVATAVDGAEAYTMLKAGTFDLVVSDVEMPRMDGFDLTMKVRTDKQLSSVPIVLITALESREHRERGIDAGANAYIVKSSFDQSNLLEVIGRLI